MSPGRTRLYSYGWREWNRGSNRKKKRRGGQRWKYREELLKLRVICGIIYETIEVLTI